MEVKYFPSHWAHQIDQLKIQFPWEHLEQCLLAVEKDKRVCPQPTDLFRALELTPLEDVKVVILGQDPYHGPGQANGLAFAVSREQRVPPSLVNIFKEIESDCGRPTQADQSLLTWARQGVLLLNSSLSVSEGQPGSHFKLGWEIITDALIEAVMRKNKPVVFILWGNFAHKKESLIMSFVSSQGEPRSPWLIIKGVHPSPLSAYRGFFGGRYFSQANKFLTQFGQLPIEW